MLVRVRFWFQALGLYNNILIRKACLFHVLDRKQVPQSRAKSSGSGFRTSSSKLKTENPKHQIRIEPLSDRPKEALKPRNKIKNL